MSNTFTNIVNVIYAKALGQLRENAIMPKLVNTNWSAEVAKQGSTINVPMPSAMTVTDVSPTYLPINSGNVAPTVVPITLNRWRKTDMFLTDKEAREIVEGAVSIQLSEAMRELANDVDSYLLALYKSVYGYAGTAGTTPFAANLSAATDARKILGNQLAPPNDRRIVLGTDAEANALLLRAVQDASFRANQANTLTTGLIGSLLGFDWYVDQNIPTHTKGAAGTPLLDDNTLRAVGTTTLHMDGYTTKPSVGDVFTIAGDTQSYVVTAATDLAGTDSDITFAPGLKVAIPAVDGNEVVTFKASHVVNLAFHRDAFALATRPLDAADGFTGGNVIRTGVDPLSGLALTLEISRQSNQTRYQWSILYGASCIRPELACRIAG